MNNFTQYVIDTCEELNRAEAQLSPAQKLAAAKRIKRDADNNVQYAKREVISALPVEVLTMSRDELIALQQVIGVLIADKRFER